MWLPPPPPPPADLEKHVAELKKGRPAEDTSTAAAAAAAAAVRGEGRLRVIVVRLFVCYGCCYLVGSFFSV